MTKRRYFSILLCLCMLLTLLPTTTAKAATKVSTVDITIDAPKAGELPAETGTVSDGQGCYVDSVEWGGVLNTDGTFRAGEKYQLKLLCKIDEGSDAVFAFGSGMNVTLNNTVVNGGDFGYWSETIYGKQYLLIMVYFDQLPAGKTSSKKIAISSEKDLQKMIDNPSGSYYLTKDITIKNKNTVLFNGTNGQFTGTFDGKGHSIKGYTNTTSASEWTRVSLFGAADGATFKNLTMKNVKIDVELNGGGAVAALADGYSCKFTNVKVTGSIKVTGFQAPSSEVRSYSVAGISTAEGTYKNCTNTASVSANLEIDMYEGISVAGISTGGYSGYNNCKNTGKITFKGHSGSATDGLTVAGIGTTSDDSGFKNCTNSGTIQVTSLTCKNRDGVGFGTTCVSGIGARGKFTGCKNTGKIIAENKNDYPLCVGGVASDEATGGSSKCANTGSVTAKPAYGTFVVGGVFSTGGYNDDRGGVSQCYNTGTVKVTTKKKKGDDFDDCIVGGVTGVTYGLTESYNTGTVSTNARCMVGGVSGYAANIYDKLVVDCYNTGKVSSGGGYYTGTIVGNYSGADSYGKRNIYDNYSTASGSLYGTSSVSWKDYVAKGTKVSSITSSSCPKLSSKYWTYSTDKKRLILKNNKEK